MTLFARFVPYVMMLLLIGGVSATTGAAPASATVTRLCQGNVACVKAGMTDSGYFFHSRSMYWRMYSGHNCTNYAAYRIVQNGGPQTRPWSGNGNATNWGVQMSRITDSKPSVGSIAWWRAGVRPAGRAGHVAYVERVVSADEIIISQDSWGGDFSWARVTRSGGGWPSGFIHFNDVPLVNTAPPAVTGTPRIGSVLKASPGLWNAGASFTYQWTQNGADIAGAKGSTLTLTSGQKGRKIAVRVTATSPGYPTATVVSAPTATVRSGALENTVAPTVTGEPTVGATLSVSPGTWSATPDSVRYQWRADGVPIPDATRATLQVSPAHVGKAVAVAVTAVRSGYADVTKTSAATSSVRPGTLNLTRAPAVTGVAQLGRTLTLSPAVVGPDSVLVVQWLRAGVPVAGATGSTYHLSAADLGSRIAARVRATREGYDQLTSLTPSTHVVRSAPVIGVTTRPGTGRLSFTATVRASGVPLVDGVIHVRSRGRLLREVTVSNGVARGTVTGLPGSTRTYRFWFVRSSTVARGMVERAVTIG